MTVGKIDLARFSSDVDQLWAEAVVREEAGESITLSEHLWDVAANVQGQRMVEDAIADVLEDAFAEKKGRVSMDSVKLLINVETARMTAMDARRIKAVMAGLAAAENCSTANRAFVPVRALHPQRGGGAV